MYLDSYSKMPSIAGILCCLLDLDYLFLFEIFSSLLCLIMADLSQEILGSHIEYEIEIF